MGKYQSGQMGQTVNLLAYAFGGSNPSLPTFERVSVHGTLFFLRHLGQTKPPEPPSQPDEGDGKFVLKVLFGGRYSGFTAHYRYLCAEI